MRTDGSQATAPLGAPVVPTRDAPSRRTRRATRLLALLGMVAAAAAIVLVVVDPFASGGASRGGAIDNGYPTGLTAVRRGTLTSQTQVSGTLGYGAAPDGSPFSVVGRISGTYTWLPSTGQVVRCGQVLYRVANNPVVLLCGSTPAYRALSEGDTGPDVRQLNANLVALGYASRAALDPASNYFSAATAYALERLQAKLGVSQTGSLSDGQAVFLPGPLRITKVIATLGTGAGPGGPLAQATTIRRQVVVNLDAAQQSSIKRGDRVVITLPNGQTTFGVVTSVGTVASSSGGSTPTVPVDIRPLDQKVAGTLDQATVEVQITNATVHDALIVPVNALLALAGGGYAVETVDDRGVHHLVAVTTGLFDDADGLVQVSGALSPGEQLVVPAS
jgi:peptidoglycan hydrolase-like protein with peptidoglycan-binding domain